MRILLLPPSRTLFSFDYSSSIFFRIHTPSFTSLHDFFKQLHDFCWMNLAETSLETVLNAKFSNMWCSFPEIFLKTPHARDPTQSDAITSRPGTRLNHLRRNMPASSSSVNLLAFFSFQFSVSVQIWTSASENICSSRLSTYFTTTERTSDIAEHCAVQGTTK